MNSNVIAGAHQSRVYHDTLADTSVCVFHTLQPFVDTFSVSLSIFGRTLDGVRVKAFTHTG
jgi:hypothetical protein